MPDQHSVPQCPVPSVSEPFSGKDHGGGRGWKQGNWDQSVSHNHYQFCPDNTSTFHFHPRNGGGRLGFSQRQWQEQEMMDMKMSFFPPFTEWMGENVVSYLVRAWLLARRIFWLKYVHPLFCFWFESWTSWTGRERYPTRQHAESCSNYQKSAKTYTDADVSMVIYAENCNDDTQFSFVKPWKNILYFIYIHFYPEINVCIFERSAK